MALLRIRDTIINNIEERKLTICIFLDFREAFHSIKHEILLEKLQVYGVRGTALELMNSYLVSRLQYTSFQGYSAKKNVIKYGAQQGSILAPLLFIVYINDRVNVPLTDEIIMCADDNNVFFSVVDFQEVEVNANSWLEELRKWLRLNQLSLNGKNLSLWSFML